MFFKSLKKEILISTLGLIVVTIFITTALGVSSIRTAGGTAEKATADVLREQAKKSLIQIAESAADRQDLLFERTRDDASNLASYTKNVYDNPSIFSTDGYWEFDTRVFKKDNRYLNKESDISTIFIPNYVTIDAQVKRDIELTANLDFIAPSVLASNPNTVAVYTIDKKGVARYFPNIILGNVVPVEHSTLDDPVYKQATPQEDPEKKIVWSALYDDPAKRGLMITVSAPIYSKDGFESVLGIDVLLISIIKTITAYSPIEGSYAFLIDKKGNTIAFPDKAYEDILGRSRKEGEVRTSLATSSPEFLAILKEMMNGSTGFGSIHSKNKELFVAYAPLNQTGFSMAIIAEEAVMLKAASILRGEILNSVQSTVANKILPASLFIILLASIISIFLVTRIVKPIRQLILGADEIGKGNLDYNLKVDSENEIGNLAFSFTQMTKNLKQSRKELKEYSESLEEKVEERTEALEQANLRLLNLDQAKSEFISIASHQLRTPLTVIKGYLSLALEGTLGSITAQAKESLGKAAFSTEQLIKLVNELLDLSRIESKTIEYHFAVNDLDKIISEVVDELRPQADKKHIVIKIEVERGMPQFVFDRDKIREVVLNVLHNAVKYTPKGKIVIHAEVIVKSAKKMVRISIKDSGIGIAKEDLQKLFVKFGRSQEAKTIDPSGMGLGLFFVKKVAQDH
ncbi:MAG: sensor histidine kinase, partial [Patescibacteria group bacterium]